MDRSAPNPRNPRHSATDDIYPMRLRRIGEPRSSAVTNHDKPAHVSTPYPGGAAAPIIPDPAAWDRERRRPDWAEQRLLKQTRSPEQVNRANVTHAVELFYTALPDDHRRLLDEMAAAESISVLQLVSKVWAAKIAHYMQDVEKALTPEELAELQELERIEQFHKQSTALVEEQTAERLNHLHAIKEPHIMKDGTVIFPKADQRWWRILIGAPGAIESLAGQSGLA